MKLLFILALGVFLSQSSFAGCVNLSGNYTHTDGQILQGLVITQKDCKTVEFTYMSLDGNSSIGKIFTTNKKVYLTNETAELKVFESASIDQNELLANVEFYYKAKNKSTTAVSHMYLDAAGDLQGEYDYYDYNGALYHQDKPVFNRNP